MNDLSPRPSCSGLLRALLIAAASSALACSGGDNSAGSNLSEQGDPITGSVCPAGATVTGIDVSTYQGSVNWPKVAGAGIKFAIARVSDGTGYADGTFAGNWGAIKQAGLIRGAYQFFEPSEDPIAQANLVIAKVGKLGAGDLPVMLDIEVTGGQSKATIVSRLHSWISAIESGTGKAPIVYTGAYFWDDDIGSSDFSSLPLNVAWYGVTCPGEPSGWSGHAWKFHQYSSSGSVNGVAGKVDMDVFNGDEASLQSFAGVSASSGGNSGGGGSSGGGNTGGGNSGGGTTTGCGGAPAKPITPTACGGLDHGQGLGKGEGVTSCDGRFTLTMQSDGNLVEYTNGVALWASGTSGHPGSVVEMQSDGNLVVYDSTSCALWSTHTSGHSGATLAVQGDGNSVIYQSGTAIWASSTGGYPASPTGCGGMASGLGLLPGEGLSSCDGNHALTMQGDGNLVIYHNGVATWATHTTGSGIHHVIMQSDGNLVMRKPDGTAIWSTGTAGKNGATLDMQNDGNLVLYQNGTAVWASHTSGK